MRTINPVLSEQAVLFIQQGIDMQLKAQGLAAFQGAALVVNELNVAWTDPVAARIAELEAELAAERAAGGDGEADLADGDRAVAEKDA